MDASRKTKYHRYWLILLVVVGLLLIFGIFSILFNAPGHGDPQVNQHPQQTVP